MLQNWLVPLAAGIYAIEFSPCNVRFCVGVYFNQIYLFSFDIGLEGKTCFPLTTSAIEMLSLNARKMSCGGKKMTIKVVLDT